MSSTALATTVTESHFDACATRKQHGSVIHAKRPFGEFVLESSSVLRSGHDKVRSVLYFGDLSSLAIRDSVVSENSAKAIITISQLIHTEISGSTFAQNQNQVLRAFQLCAGDCTVDRCLFADNVAETRTDGVVIMIKEV